MKATLFLTLFLSLSGSMLAQTQLGFTGGPDYCWVRNNNILENEKPVFSYTLGAFYRFNPIKKWPKISGQYEALISRKGYQQNLDKNYIFKFNYISINLIANYPVSNQVTVQGGLEFSELFYTNLLKGMKTYNHFDLGLVTGLTIFEKLPAYIYLRARYGLLPMLNYYKIDKMGNFTEKFSDLKNTSISLGVNINLIWSKPKIDE